MMTDKIEQVADIGGISSPDLNLPYLLRREIIPQFMHDVGYVSWRRKVYTFSTVIGTKTYQLPTDVEIINFIGMPSLTADSLQYIGEDPQKLSKAVANVTNATPAGYYRDYDPSTLKNDKLSFDAPAAGVVSTNLIYYSTPFFADDTTPVEMDKFVPPHFQMGLVWGLRAAICYFRFSIGDPRFVAAESQYGKTVERAMDNKEQARRNTPVFAR